ALSYASLASIYPEDGGGYLFSRRLLGPFPGFISGWAMYISSIIVVVFVLLGFGIYVNLLFGTGIDTRLLALFGLAILMMVNLRGASGSGRVEVALVTTKVAILLIFIFYGLIHFGGGSYTPFVPYGGGSVFSGMALVFFAYMGFQVVTMMSGEIKQSSRNVPMAIMISLAIVALVYIGVLVALLSANLPTYGDSSVYDAAVALIGSSGGILVGFAAVISTLSSANANIMGGSRIVLEMACEKQVPGRFARLYHQQPIYSIILLAIVSVLLILYGNLETIIELTNMAMLLTMLLVNISAVLLHGRANVIEKNKSYFKIPGGALLPVVGAASCVIMLATLSYVTFILGALLILSGAAVYLLEDTAEGKRITLDIRRQIRR
nr:APC family permease [Candidatus Methanofastidiosa archaeon]